MAYIENWKKITGGKKLTNGEIVSICTTMLLGGHISIHGKDIAPSKNRKSNIKRVIAMLESQLEEDE